VAAAHACAPLAPDRVDFVDENEARSRLAGLLEHVAHSRRSDTDKHLDKVGAANRIKRDVCFPRNSSRQQRLSRSGRAHHQNSLRYPCAYVAKTLRVFQKFNDFRNLLLRFVAARHVLKSHPILVGSKQARPALSEAHRASAGGPHLARKQKIKHAHYY